MKYTTTLIAAALLAAATVDISTVAAAPVLDRRSPFDKPVNIDVPLLFGGHFKLDHGVNDQGGQGAGVGTAWKLEGPLGGSIGGNLNSGIRPGEKSAGWDSNLQIKTPLGSTWEGTIGDDVKLQDGKLRNDLQASSKGHSFLGIDNSNHARLGSEIGLNKGVQLGVDGDLGGEVSAGKLHAGGNVNGDARTSVGLDGVKLGGGLNGDGHVGFGDHPAPTSDYKPPPPAPGYQNAPGPAAPTHEQPGKSNPGGFQLGLGGGVKGGVGVGPDGVKVGGEKEVRGDVKVGGFDANGKHTDGGAATIDLNNKGIDANVRAGERTTANVGNVPIVAGKEAGVQTHVGLGDKGLETNGQVDGKALVSVANVGAGVDGKLGAGTQVGSKGVGGNANADANLNLGRV